MKKVLAVIVVLALAVWVRDNNVHYVLKGLLAAWPLLALLAIAGVLVTQGLGLRRHGNFTYGPSKGTNWGRKIGDPLQDARDRAERAGLDIHIPDVDDIYRP